MTKSIKTSLTEDKEANENLCSLLQRIRRELRSGEEEGDLALRQIVITPIADENILDLKDDIFNMIESGPHK